MRSPLKLTLLLASVFATGCQTYNLEGVQPSEQDTAASELINRSEVVAIVSSVDIATDLEQKAANWGYELKRKEALPGLELYVLTFDCPPGIDPYVASVELERLQPQSTVEANHKYTIQSVLESANTVRVPDSVPEGLQYANDLIEWPEDGCEALVNIGIIDGQVDMDAWSDNPAFKIISKQFSKGELAPEASTHGTAIADILVGSGRLHNAMVYNASVISQDKYGVQYSGVEPMLKALDWMIRQDVRVVNVSLAGPYNRTLDRGIQRAAEKGLIIVAAVGNDGANAAPRYPAAFSDVIAATAVDSHMHVYEKAVRGDHVDVSAPGVEIYVGADNAGRYVSGTSIAVPFVAAKIASDIRYKDTDSVSDIRELLRQDSLDVGLKGPDPVYGAGLIQANNCHH